MAFSNVAPYVIAFTLAACSIILYKVDKKDLHTYDSVASLLGIITGVVISFLNLVYSNNYLITIGPLVSIICSLYLLLRKRIYVIDINNIFNQTNNSVIKSLSIFFWICILLSTIILYLSRPNERNLLFFIIISLAVMILGIRIALTKFTTISKYTIICDIFVISFILRASGYFISSSSVGSDPWDHADLIKDILLYSGLDIPNISSISKYYTNYPIMHILSVSNDLISNLNIKESMFITSIALILSTIFVYIIAKMLTKNENIALLSMLLINFSDFHIQWSIQIIAMSLGIAFYIIIIYLLIKRSENYNLFYDIFIIILFYLIIWTHTVSAFIMIISTVCLYATSLIYSIIFKSSKKYVIGSILLCLVCITLLFFHWSDPSYDFLSSTTSQLTVSVDDNAQFLNRTTSTVASINYTSSSIFNIVGFLSFMLFGIVGCLYSLSNKNLTIGKVSIMLTLLVLFFIFFVFPVMGLNNIVPYRWPAFIYTILVVFTSIGLLILMNIINNKYINFVLLAFILLFISFFMITNYISNIDSPIYDKNTNQRLMYTDAEMSLFTKVNNVYDGKIISDTHTINRPFRVYFKRTDLNVYPIYYGTDVRDWVKYTNKALIIWRSAFDTTPIQAYYDGNQLVVLLGEQIREGLDKEFITVFDYGDAKGYIYITPNTKA